MTLDFRSDQPIEQVYAPIPGIRKIAVLRCNGIGDFVFSLPALEALRAAYPHAEIVLLGLDWHASFLAGRHVPVDRVEIVPQSRSLFRGPKESDDPAEMERFIERMAAERFDLAVQMYGGGRYSNPFIKRLKPRLSIGLKTADAEPLDRWIPYEYYQMEVLRFLELVSLVGASPVILEPHLHLTHADLEEAARVVPHSSQPLVVIHPGVGDPRRRWPAENFAAVGDFLARAGARVVVVGTQPDCDLAERVVQGIGPGALNSCGQLSLNGLAGLLSRTHLVISSDSGPLHLAKAVGAATVGIYWCSNMINAGPISHSRHRTAISWRVICPVCAADLVHNDCQHTESIVSDVTVEEVLAGAFDLLKAGKLAGVNSC